MKPKLIEKPQVQIRHKHNNKIPKFIQHKDKPCTTHD